MLPETETVKISDGSLPGSLHITLSGKLRREDYDMFVPAIESAIGEYGKLNLLVELKDFHGWSVGALWEDVKFDIKHFNHVKRLAIVGDKKWEAGMAVFCNPFTTAKVSYFDKNELESALKWIDSAENV